MAALDNSGVVVWATRVADPRVLRAEFPESDGTLSGRTLLRPDVAIDIDIPEGVGAKTLRVLEPDGTDPARLGPVDTVTIP